ncbi:MAG: DNA primase DnaG [Halorientalis sp.]
MQDTAKYLIHADVRADGVVERTDVVGAVFGQTEGLLGDGLDLRDLQEASKVGRIDVEVTSEGGRSHGEVTIASGLDKAETAVLAAALETIDQVGPCRAEFEVTGLEDVRAAKRRQIVERATELLADLEDVMSSADLVTAVREAARVEDVTEYEGLPAGPRVADSDAVVVVEGRADVVRLLRYGVKNAVAVEGTNVPDAVADLTGDRTVTAFLDGDRGGDLILKELAQVGDVDYVTFAPQGRSVEDLSRDEAMAALREKVPFGDVADANAPHEAVAAERDRPAPPEATGDGQATEGERDAADGESAEATGGEAASENGAGAAHGTSSEPAAAPGDRAADEREDESADGADAEGDGSAAAAESTATGGSADDGSGPPETLVGHVERVVGDGTGEVVLLDSEFGVLGRAPADAAFETVAESEQVPASVVLDGELDQRLLDVTAQRGVEQVVARSAGEFVKQPTGVRVRTADQFEVAA